TGCPPIRSPPSRRRHGPPTRGSGIRGSGGGRRGPAGRWRWTLRRPVSRWGRTGRRCRTYRPRPCACSAWSILLRGAAVREGMVGATRDRIQLPVLAHIRCEIGDDALVTVSEHPRRVLTPVLDRRVLVPAHRLPVCVPEHRVSGQQRGVFDVVVGREGHVGGTVAGAQ